MRKSVLFIIILFSPVVAIYSQFDIQANLEVEADKEHAILATSTQAYGVFASGQTGIWSIAQGKEGSGVYGHAGFGLYGVQGYANRDNQDGVVGWATGATGEGIVGIGSGENGKGIFGRALDKAEWAAYLWGGKGVIIRPRLSIENHDPQYPIHAGTLGQGNGNGAHLSDGGSWVSGSSRSIKENFEKIDPQEILSKVAQLNLTSWHYRNSNEGIHLGPMAEDFYAAFGLGDSDKYIASVDADGIALASIQALLQRIKQMEIRYDQLFSSYQELLVKFDGLQFKIR